MVVEDFCLIFCVVVVLVFWVEVVVVVDFMGFVLGGRGGFFYRWWWVTCGRGDGNGWLKERDSEEKKKGETEIGLYYFIG